MKIAKQTVVRELLLGQCCEGLFAIVAVSCMQLSVISYIAGSVASWRKESEIVSLQYLVWLLCNIDSKLKSRATTNVCLHVSTY